MPGDRAGVGEGGDLVDHDPAPSGVVGGGRPVLCEHRVEAVGAARPEALDELGHQLALPLHQRDAVVGLHDVVGGDALEHADLHLGPDGHHEVGAVAHERISTGRREGRLLDAAAEAPDQVAREVLDRRQAAA